MLCRHLLVHLDTHSELNPVIDIQPVKLVSPELSQPSIVLACVGDDTGRSIEIDYYAASNDNKSKTDCRLHVQRLKRLNFRSEAEHIPDNGWWYTCKCGHTAAAELRVERTGHCARPRLYWNNGQY